MSELKAALDKINEKYPSSGRTTAMARSIVKQIQKNTPRRWGVVKEEIASLINEIPNTEKNRTLLSVLAAKKDVHEAVFQAMIVKNFSPDSPKPAEALARLLFQAFSADLSREYLSAQKTTQGKKKGRSEGAKIIEKVASNVLEVQGEPRPLLEAWLAAQGIPSMNFAIPVEWDNRQFVLTDWREGRPVPERLTRQAKEELEKAKTADVVTQSMNIEGEEGGEVLQIADPKTILARDGKGMTTLSLDEFEGALKEIEEVNLEKTSKAAMATLWSSFWDAMDENAVEIFRKVPALLPSDAWAVLGARASIEDKGIKGFAKGPMTTDALEGVLQKLEEVIKEGAKSEKNKPKLVANIPEAVVDVVASSEGFQSPNAPTGKYTWKDVLKQLGKKDLPIIPVDRADVFYSRLGAALNRKKPDDRGILFDLGAGYGDSGEKRDPNPCHAPKKKRPKGK